MANVRIIWAPTGIFRSTCDLNMFKFPFDVQTCSLDFGNVIHVKGTVTLVANIDEVDQGFYLDSKEFR